MVAWTAHKELWNIAYYARFPGFLSATEILAHIVYNNALRTTSEYNIPLTFLYYLVSFVGLSLRDVCASRVMLRPRCRKFGRKQHSKTGALLYPWKQCFGTQKKTETWKCIKYTVFGFNCCEVPQTLDIFVYDVSCFCLIWSFYL